MKAHKVEFDSGSVCVGNERVWAAAEHQKWSGADMTGIFISPLGRLAAPFFIIFHLGLPPFAPLFIICSSAASPFFLSRVALLFRESPEDKCNQNGGWEMKSKSLFPALKCSQRLFNCVSIMFGWKIVENYFSWFFGIFI